MNYVFALFGLFIEQPWLALLPAMLMAIVALYSRSRFVWIVTALWVLYAAYEFGVSIRLLCSGECNIRVDLLLFAPVLIALTVIAIVKVYGTVRSREQP